MSSTARPGGANPGDTGTTDIQSRQRWMSVLARANSDALHQQVEKLGDKPGYVNLRGPETGLIMVRGRANGDGQKFNLGETSVTRCSVRLEDGTVGHAYIAGRDRPKAELAAVLDAMLQTPRHNELEETIIAPLEQSWLEARALRSKKAAATKVDFFTMVRGEDA